MTSEEIEKCTPTTSPRDADQLFQIGQWLQEIAYQLSRMNERLDEFEVK